MRRNRHHVVYPALGAVLLLLFPGVGCGGVHPVHAQSSAPGELQPGSVQWRLHLDGERADWPLRSTEASVDRLRTVGSRVLSHLRRSGYYYATLDSVKVDSTGNPALVHFYAHRGPKVRIGELRVVGTKVLSSESVAEVMKTSERDVLRSDRLETDIQRVLKRYEDAGRPLAEIRVDEAVSQAVDEPTLGITLRVDEGPELWLKEIDVSDDARTSPELIAQLADLTIGKPLRNFDLKTLQRRLETKDLFTSVGSPELRVGDDGGGVLKIPIDEAAPGAFDFLLGYLPPSRTRDSGQFVGVGHLLLKNLFGGGRTVDLTLDRRPGRTSIVDVAVSDPYFLKLPLRVEGTFRGEQRDSTYGERSYGMEAGYRLTEGLELTANLSRDIVRPGPAGTALRGGRQEIPRSKTLFYGIGFRYRQVDRVRNPRSGISINVQFSQGRKQRQTRRITAQGDTSRISDSFQQERFRGRIRGYLPLFNRQVLAVGGEGGFLFSPDRFWDRSDLFRLGGSSSLRGYDEDRFLGNVVGRALLEYRLQVDPTSYVFAFADAGYVARPVLNGTSELKGWHPGYGVGMELQTEIGRISTTYALNPDVENPVNGRVHLGLSVGL